MRSILIILLMMISVHAWGQSSSVSMALPSSSQSYQSDRVRAGQFECTQAIGSATNLEFGVVGVLNQNDPYDTYNQQNVGVYPEGYDPNGFVRDVGVYAKITIPLGKVPKTRLDCNRLYQLELRARELEIKKLEAEVYNLRNLKFAEGTD